MTASEKRDYMRFLALKPLTSMLPDIGAKRGLEILNNGSDAEIDFHFEHFKETYEKDLTRPRFLA